MEMMIIIQFSNMKISRFFFHISIFVSEITGANTTKLAYMYSIVLLKMSINVKCKQMSSLNKQKGKMHLFLWRTFHNLYLSKVFKNIILRRYLVVYVK
jgi:hypothetical protein